MAGLLFLLFPVLLWFLFVQPQRRRQRAHVQLLQSVGVGADVITVGGIYGTVTRTDGDDLILEISEGVEVRVVRRAIAQIVEPASGADMPDLPQAGGDAPGRPGDDQAPQD
jgi:preprotein translocase subunit YajC